MKDSFGFLLKLSVVLLVLLLILYYSVEYMTNRHEGFSFNSTPSKADFNDAFNMYTRSSATGETIQLNLDKGILGKIFGVDLDKMIKDGNTAFAAEVSGARNSRGQYKMPDYTYCDKRNWIPKSAISSLCPNCDPEKL